MSSTRPAQRRVLVAGGGVAGLETLLALRDLAGDRVESTLLTPEEDFVYRPMAVAQPFARGHAQRHRLADVAHDVGARLVRGRLDRVDEAERTVLTSDGERIGYDTLVVAVGARAEPAMRHAMTWTPELDDEVFGGLLRDLEEGYTGRVAFVVPRGVAWSLPAYELALMTGWQARTMQRDDVQIAIYTPETAPLAIFGAAATAALLEDLDELGIRVIPGVDVTDAADGSKALAVQPGSRRLEAERVVALPRAAGSSVPGLPSDDRGFIPTDPHGKVLGTDAVWAAGDAIAFPIKQGGLAAQQADAAAEAIAQQAGAAVDPQPFHPVLRGVLLTGRGKAWLRNDPSARSEGGSVARHALFWPPTKVAGRYLSPYLAALAASDVDDESSATAPAGHAVDLDIGRDPAAIGALARATGAG